MKKSKSKTICSENNLLLMHYLHLTGVAESRKALAQDVQDWLAKNGQSNYFSNLLTATYSFPTGAVKITRKGDSDQLEITKFGEQFLVRKTPIWVRGKGWFARISDNTMVLTREM